MTDVPIGLAFPSQLLERVPGTLPPIGDSQAFLLPGKRSLHKHGLQTQDVHFRVLIVEPLCEVFVEGFSGRVESQEGKRGLLHE